MNRNINYLVETYYKVYIDSSSILDDRFQRVYDAIEAGNIYTTSANINEINGLSHSDREVAENAARFYRKFKAGGKNASGHFFSQISF